MLVQTFTKFSCHLQGSFHLIHIKIISPILQPNKNMHSNSFLKISIYTTTYHALHREKISNSRINKFIIICIIYTSLDSPVEKLIIENIVSIPLDFVEKQKKMHADNNLYLKNCITLTNLTIKSYRLSWYNILDSSYKALFYNFKNTPANKLLIKCSYNPY